VDGSDKRTLIAGAGHTKLIITVPSTAQVDFEGTLRVKSVRNFTPYTDQTPGAMWHGGNVSPATKHVLNVGVLSQAASFAPAELMLVDVLGCYPNIDGTILTSQNLTNTGAALPRYTDGVGVQAYLVLSSASGGASTFLGNLDFIDAGNNPHFVVASGSYILWFSPSGFAGRIWNAGVGVNSNCGPFVPLDSAWGGIKSVQMIDFGNSASTCTDVALVLCKPILSLPVTAVLALSERNFLTQDMYLPRIYDGACLNWLYSCGAAAVMSPFHGYLDFVWG